MTTAVGEPDRLAVSSVDVLASIHQHRVLTARQVHELHLPSCRLRSTQKMLVRLADHGLVQSASGPHRLGLWFLTRHGAETLDRCGTLAEHRRHLSTPTEAVGLLRKHTMAVNDTGIAFVKAARSRPGDECGPFSWRHEIAHPISNGRARHKAQLVIADALLSYLQQTPHQSLILQQRFIELDRGTIPPEQLAGKLARYAQLQHHKPNPAPSGAPEGPSWRAYYRTFPTVLVVLADQTPAAARRRIQRVIALHRTDPQQARYGTVPTLFVTLTDLAEQGPFALIFISIEQPENYQDWLGNTHHNDTKGDTDVNTQNDHPILHTIRAEPPRRSHATATATRRE
jgi:hypothetical protein